MNIHDEDPDNGRHPEYKHLVWYDLDREGPGYIVTSEASEGSLFVSSSEGLEGWFSPCEKCNQDHIDSGGGYACDDYLDLFDLEDE